MKERVNASPYFLLVIPVLAALALHGLGRDLSPAERALLERAGDGATATSNLNAFLSSRKLR